MQQVVSEQDINVDFLMALQPVYCRNLDIAAFELLLEDTTDTNESSRSSDDICRLVLDTYGSIHQHGKVNVVPIFLEMSDAILLDEELSEISPQQFILQISAADEFSPEYIETLKTWANKGYRLALSDYSKISENAKPLLDIVNILKLDINEYSPEELHDLVEEMKPHGLELYVHSIHSSDEFHDCHDMDFHYFNGEIFETPTKSAGKKIGSNKLLLLQLLAELQNPDATIKSLEDITIKDANLTFKLLKIINSAAFSNDRQIESISHAINMLGIDQLGRWVTLFLLEGNMSRNNDLMRTMLIRGRMCEVLAGLTGRDKVVSHFITGLLSQLDVLMDMPMEDLMSQVALSEDIKDSLLHRLGSMGEILVEVEHYGNGDFQKLKGLVGKSSYESAYRHSNSWASNILSTMDSEAA